MLVTSYPTAIVMPSCLPLPSALLSYANEVPSARVALSPPTLCPNTAAPQSPPAARCIETCVGCSLVCALRLRSTGSTSTTKTLTRKSPAALSPALPCATRCTTSAPGPRSLPWIQASTLDTRDLIGELFFPPTVTGQYLPAPVFQPGIVFHPLCGPSAAQLLAAILFPLSPVSTATLLSDLLAVLHLGLLSDSPARYDVVRVPSLLPEASLQPLHRSVCPLTCLADALHRQAALLVAPPPVLAWYPLQHRPSAAQVAYLPDPQLAYQLPRPEPVSLHRLRPPPALQLPAARQGARSSATPGSHGPSPAAASPSCPGPASPWSPSHRAPASSCPSRPRSPGSPRPCLGLSAAALAGPSSRSRPVLPASPPRSPASQRPARTPGKRVPYPEQPHTCHCLAARPARPLPGPRLRPAAQPPNRLPELPGSIWLPSGMQRLGYVGLY